ncbi:hypothetical protein FQZ97_1093100 [compost metagenome]
MDRRIIVQAVDQVEKFLLRCIFRQIVLNRNKAAFLGLLALRGHINLACRVFADNNHCNAGYNPGRIDELFGLTLHRGNHILGELLAIDQLGHIECSVLNKRCLGIHRLDPENMPISVIN